MWKSGSWTQWDILPQIYLKTCPDFRERQAEHTAWFPQWAGRWCCEAAVSEQAVAIFPLRRAVFQTGASPGRLGTGSDSCSALYRQPGPFPASSVCCWASYLCSTWTTNEQSPAPREELGFTRKKVQKMYTMLATSLETTTKCLLISLKTIARQMPA